MNTKRETMGHSSQTELQTACQVIVVGSGLAGLSAACAALRKGACVLLLEAESSLGCFGGRAEESRALELGVDNIDNLPDDEFRAVNWLAQTLGINAKQTLDDFNGPPLGIITLHALGQAIETAAESSRLQVVTGVQVQQLLLTSKGECAGCTYAANGRGKIVQAKGVVLLCCGGFLGNASCTAMLAKYRPDLLHLSRASTGGAGACAAPSGIALARSAGAQSVTLERLRVHATALAGPSARRQLQLAARALRSAGGVLLSETGSRICDELRPEADIAYELLRCKGPILLVLDHSSSERAKWHVSRCAHQGFMRHYSNTEALAVEMGVSKFQIDEALFTPSASDRQCNLASQHATEDEAGHEVSCVSSAFSPAKTLSYSAKHSKGLWVALVKPAVWCCNGGVLVRADSGAVTGEDDEPIVGLFAAGEIAASTDDAGSNSSPVLHCIASALTAGSVAASHVLSAPFGVELGRAFASNVEEESISMREDMETIHVKKLHAKMAKRRLQRHLDMYLTAHSLQQSLTKATMHGGDLTRASEDLLKKLLSSKGVAVTEMLAIALREQAFDQLPERKQYTALFKAEESTVCEINMSCVYCRLPLKLQVFPGLAQQSTQGPHADHKSQKDFPRHTELGGPFAYATLLYGSGAEYFLGALVLGWSLQANGCQDNRLLLHTDDVPAPYLEVLQQYWTLRQVEHLSGVQALYKDWDNSRFKDVFTKLQALSCTDYAKLLMMDLDMLVRDNLDELFQLNTPAALKRCSGQEQPPHGGHFYAEDLWRSHRDGMSSGINAGVMLLQPDLTVYERIIGEIQTQHHPEHIGTDGPEQNYLARFYTTFGTGAWTHIHARFNYQPMLPDDYVGESYRKLDVRHDVAVAHFSGRRVKPWKIQGIELDVSGVRRFLEDNTLQELMGMEIHQVDARQTSLTPGMYVMPVLQSVRNSPLPEPVREVMWEWVSALRRCNLELLEAGVDLLTMMTHSAKTK